MRRGSSTIDISLAMNREIDSNFEDVKKVAENIDKVITVSGLDLDILTDQVDDLIQRLVSIKVEHTDGSEPIWDDADSTLYIPAGPKGETGTGIVSISSGSPTVDGMSYDILLSNGVTYPIIAKTGPAGKNTVGRRLSVPAVYCCLAQTHTSGIHPDSIRQ